MKVRVLMFGALADEACRDDVFDIDGAPDAASVVHAVESRYPRAKTVLAHSCVAVNQEIVDATHRIDEGDEVALLPPMSGGAIDVALTSTPSADSALASVASPSAGGTALFVGTVRDSCDRGSVTRLEYTAYEAMATKVMAEIAEEAVQKWNLHGVAIEHGIGSREAGEVTFVVACAAPHRDEAFDACRYVVDEVKRRTPIWKKEFGPWGERWIGL